MRSYSIFGIIAVARSRVLTAWRPHWPSIAAPFALRCSVVISSASGMRRCDCRNPLAPRSPTAFLIFSAKTGVYSTQWPSPSMTGCESFDRICSGLACALISVLPESGRQQTGPRELCLQSLGAARPQVKLAPGSTGRRSRQFVEAGGEAVQLPLAGERGGPRPCRNLVLEGRQRRGRVHGRDVAVEPQSLGLARQLALGEGI